jgi:HEAT repeat protein
VREQLRSEPNPMLRVAYASALSQFGQERDDAGMAQVLDELKDPSLQGLAASALAFHGTRDALGSLRRMASDPQGSSVRRAAAIEGLAMMLGRTAPYSFSEVSRQANYTVFSDWLKGMLQVSL